MFERIRKALGKGAADRDAATGTDPVHSWAREHGYTFTGALDGWFALRGQCAGKPWRLERVPPGRPFIVGAELRARAELELRPELAVMLMNRELKEALETQVYADFTGSLQTTVDAGQAEEQRWLSLFDEMTWEGASEAFWSRFAVLADRRDDAQAWLDDALAGLLLGWPGDAPGAETPFTMMLTRGKLYLRLQYQNTDLETLAHAATVFTTACERALAVPPTAGI